MGDDGLPWTTYGFADLDILAGDYAGETFGVLCAGGELDGMVSEIVGTPHFQIGDRAIVFYDEDDPICQFAGWEQGTLRVTTDNGQEVVLRDKGVAITGC